MPRPRAVPGVRNVQAADGDYEEADGLLRAILRAMDHEAKRLRGEMQKALSLAVTGFGLAAASGLLMFATQAAELLANRAFTIKMLLLFAAAGNAAAPAEGNAAAPAAPAPAAK